MHKITKFWFLKDFNLFKKLSKNNLMSLMAELEMVNVKRGEVLQLKRDDKKLVYFIKTGVIKIEAKETDHTLSVLNAGNIFGERSIYEDEEKTEVGEKAIVLENGVVCVVEAKQMKTLLDKYPSMKNELLNLHGIQIEKLQSNLIDLLYKDSETRIKDYVLNYIHEFGRKTEMMISAKNLLTHQDIAQLTNTSRQTVSNVLSKLRKEGTIGYDAKEIYIPGKE